MTSLPYAPDQFNPKDRYSVKEALRLRGKRVLDDLSMGMDNGVTDMANITISEFAELGVNDNVLREAICLFYRDHPEMIDALKETQDGADYLRGLEAQI